MKTANYVNIIYGENVTEFVCTKDVNQQLKKEKKNREIYSFHNEICANQFRQKRREQQTHGKMEEEL